MSRNANKKMPKREQRNMDYEHASRATRHGVSANHLLNFSLPEREKPTHFNPTNRKKKQAPMRTQNEFLLANFRFVVSPIPHDVYVSCWDVDALTDWRYVEQMLLWCDEANEMQCPICLDAYRAPKVTRCGHIFCWPCILRYLSMTDNYWRRCPMCFESVQKSHLRSVSLQRVQLPPRLEATATFQFLQRSKSSLFPHLRDAASTTPPSTRMKRKLTHLPGVNDRDAMFSRVMEATPEYVQYLVMDEMRELQTLEQELQSSGDLETIPFVQEAIRHTSSRLSTPVQRTEHQMDAEHFMTKKQRSRSEEVADKSDAYSFYQIANGSYVVLHPLNMKCLLKEFTESKPVETQDHVDAAWTESVEPQPTSQAPVYHLLPESIQARVLDVEHMVMDDDAQKRFRFLSHLPRFCDFYLCELDLSDYLSSTTREHFKTDLQKRENQRNQKHEAQRKRLAAKGASTSPVFKHRMPPSFSLEQDGEAWPAPAEAALADAFQEGVRITAEEELAAASNPEALSPSLLAALAAAASPMYAPTVSSSSPPTLTAFALDSEGSFATVTRNSGYFPRLGGDSGSPVVAPAPLAAWGSTTHSPLRIPEDASSKSKKKAMKKGKAVFSTSQRRSYR